MRTAFDIVNDVNLKLRGVVYTADFMSNELLYEMINEARKEAAIEFFKWNASHISEYINYLRRADLANGTSTYLQEMDIYERTTIENRYKIFEESK